MFSNKKRLEREQERDEREPERDRREQERDRRGLQDGRPGQERDRPGQERVSDSSCRLSWPSIFAKDRLFSVWVGRLERVCKLEQGERKRAPHGRA